MSSSVRRASSSGVGIVEDGRGADGGGMRADELSRGLVVVDADMLTGVALM